MKKLATAAILAASLVSSNVIAQTVIVTITNLTNGIIFTPALVAAHNATTKLFKAGQPASESLKAMAEGGDLAALKIDLANTAALLADQNTVMETPSTIAAGASVQVELNTNTNNTHLTVLAMMLPTNDGFIGLNGVKLPAAGAERTFHLAAYDAGSEANNELIFPTPANAGDPTGGSVSVLGIPMVDFVTTAGSNGTGVTVIEANHNVHIHRGIIGDSDLAGGISDLDNTVHRWLNPVASVKVVVAPATVMATP